MVWVGGVVWGEWWCGWDEGWYGLVVWFGVSGGVGWDEGWYGLVVWFGVSGGVVGMRGGMGWWCGLG